MNKKRPRPPGFKESEIEAAAKYADWLAIRDPPSGYYDHGKFIEFKRRFE